MKLKTADTFYSCMNTWMEEIAGGCANVVERRGLTSADFIRRMYDMAPLPWLRLIDLRKHYGVTATTSTTTGDSYQPAQHYTPNYNTAQKTFYGDGYDPAIADELTDNCTNTKSRWWHIKSRRLADNSKSPAESRQPSHTRSVASRFRLHPPPPPQLTISVLVEIHQREAN